MGGIYGSQDATYRHTCEGCGIGYLAMTTVDEQPKPYIVVSHHTVVRFCPVCGKEMSKEGQDYMEKKILGGDVPAKNRRNAADVPLPPCSTCKCGGVEASCHLKSVGRTQQCRQYVKKEAGP